MVKSLLDKSAITAGVQYVAWLKANKLRDTAARRYAFISGWSIRETTKRNWAP